jgi:REP element-mobilizing transposase RayT
LHYFGWCTKYRYKMFRKPELRKICEQVLHEVAERHGIGISEVN